MGSTDTGSNLIDITRVPLEDLADLESPALRRVISALAEEARRPEPEHPFDFSSAV
ncbi:FxSxx-COOH cyclophane-containing RiPP peptide [Actinoplanes sp. NPDC051851]|uniref:FxSxx-COOH cyclophane-containing RiPP peptide n=1 Tax=Actinoplanes sp. NPDC051851 TaxID=3154753 RepID=UPI003423BCBC